MAIGTTTSVSGLLAQAWDKKFLEIATPMLKHEQLCTIKKVSSNTGKVVNYTRYTVPANSSTLAEGTVPTLNSPTVQTVTATIAEEGYAEGVSMLLFNTGLDDGMTQRAEVLGIHAGNTLDQRARDEMFTGATVYLANGKGAITSLAGTDKLDSPNIRKAVRLLKTAFAPMRKSTGRYAAVISEYAEYDLLSDATWVGAKQYSDVNDLYNSYIGTFLGVDFVTSNQGKSEASTVTVWSNFFMGDEAVGKIDLNGLSKPRLQVKTSDNHDTSQPIDTYMTIGWKSYVTYKTLNPAYIVNVKTGTQG